MVSDRIVGQAVPVGRGSRKATVGGLIARGNTNRALHTRRPVGVATYVRSGHFSPSKLVSPTVGLPQQAESPGARRGSSALPLDSFRACRLPATGEMGQ